MIQTRGSALSGSKDNMHAHACVVLLPVVQDDRALNFLLLKSWKLCQCLLLPYHVTRRHSPPRPGNEIVHLPHDEHHRELPPLLDGNHQGKRSCHEGGALQHESPLLQVFGHDLHHAVIVVKVLEDVEWRLWGDLLLEGQSEIPESAMNELCALAACARCKVSLIDECHREPPEGRILRNTCARRAAADDEHVEGLGPHPLLHGVPRRRHEHLVHLPINPLHRTLNLIRLTRPKPRCARSPRHAHPGGSPGVRLSERGACGPAGQRPCAP
mmetsp:Transcript_60004/g.147553  ORF Transcript_60004/g.147553 Transcript_60004/m.147553 type:complete len:270 (-) Transcript_60004:211-1020(-)